MAADNYKHTQYTEPPQEPWPCVKQLGPGAPWEENKHTGPAKHPGMPFPPQLCFLLCVCVCVTVCVIVCVCECWLVILPGADAYCDKRTNLVGSGARLHHDG